MTKELEFLVKTITKAAHYTKSEYEIKDKDSQGDVVTENDERVEEYIIRKIKKEYPNFDIVSEEKNEKREISENCFVIDPIDGTINYSTGSPFWGMMGCCIKGGKTVASVIFLPAFNELYYADENGAFRNGKPISATAGKSPAQLSVEYSTFAVEGGGHIQNEDIVTQMRRSKYYRRVACAAVNFAYVASGRLGAMVFLNNKPWDFMPGLHLCEMAGATISSADGIHVAANSQEMMKELRTAAEKTKLAFAKTGTIELPKPVAKTNGREL